MKEDLNVEPAVKPRKGRKRTKTFLPNSNVEQSVFPGVEALGSGSSALMMKNYDELFYNQYFTKRRSRAVWEFPTNSSKLV